MDWKVFVATKETDITKSFLTYAVRLGDLEDTARPGAAPNDEQLRKELTHKLKQERIKFSSRIVAEDEMD